MHLLPKSPTVKTPAERFSGDVYLNMIVVGEEPSRVRVGAVRFTPGAHTAWHWHGCGQTLHCTDGLGLVVTADEVVVLRPGDTVWTPPGQWHWHGAAPEQFMAHLSITEAPSPGSTDPETTWGEHVTDADYAKASAAI
ncbi:MAG TPA: cupin domain-containing protein [Propionicimonas sp.]|nr:cupin domain-containing protein [Propionicimonas sp.]HRA07056.1 cupin domain-containing protein [Propionicimonas sp.]